MAHFIAQKDPSEVTDFGIDWSDWLAGDSIATSTWTVPTGITKDSDASTGTTTTIWLSGGTDETDYNLLNTIVSAGGRTEERDILILCRVSGVYTIGGRHIIDDIRFDIDDEGPSDFDYSKDRINTLIRRAVDYYSLHRPYIRETTLDISTDVSWYLLPADCMRVVELDYRTTEEIDDETLDHQYPWLYEDWDSPALTMIRNELIARYDDLGQGVWEQVNWTVSIDSGQYVILYPPPDEDDTIDMRYVATHVRSAADYNTVPAEDADIIMDYVVGLILRRKATQIGQGIIIYRAGQTRTQRDPQWIKRESRERLESVRRRLEGNIIARSRRGTP
jgi:hypothetical protein